ncbi:MAG: anaerobic ribonucleoside-triphosphate reductase activating protein [Romboutsia sp.]
MKFSKIKDNDIANGIGITMSIWTQGCPHHCSGCFNVETWNFNSGKEFTNNDLRYILENINKNNIKRDLSILGGEPLCIQNVEDVIYLCKKFREYYPEKIIYLWTGYVIEDFNDIQKQVLRYIDILVDGKFEEDKKNLSIKLRGSLNQRIIDVNRTLDNKEITIYKVV